MAAGSAAIFFSSRMSPAAFTMHTLTVSRDTSRPAKYSIFLSLGCHIECQDSRLGPTARLLHLCRLGLDGKVPDHSTFSKNRHGRFRASDLLRKLFETVVGRCMKEGIVGGEAFAIDASIIVADAHRRRGVAKIEDLDPTSNRAVAEYLSVLDDAAEQFDLTPSRLVADGGYGSAERVGWLVEERGIEPHVNLIDKSERTDGTF